MKDIALRLSAQLESARIGHKENPPSTDYIIHYENQRWTILWIRGSEEKWGSANLAGLGAELLSIRNLWTHPDEVQFQWSFHFGWANQEYNNRIVDEVLYQRGLIYDDLQRTVEGYPELVLFLILEAQHTVR